MKNAGTVKRNAPPDVRVYCPNCERQQIPLREQATVNKETGVSAIDNPAGSGKFETTCPACKQDFAFEVER